MSTVVVIVDVDVDVDVDVVHGQGTSVQRFIDELVGAGLQESAMAQKKHAACVLD